MASPTVGLKRFEDWPTRLHAFLEARKLESFKWGVQDCCLFACDAVLAMTGTDLAADFRGKYDSAKTAFKVMGDAEVDGIAEKIAAQFGIREVKPPFAGRGDVVFCAPDGNASMGVLGVVSLGSDFVWVPGEHVLAKVPLSGVIRAWKI